MQLKSFMKCKLPTQPHYTSEVNAITYTLLPWASTSLIVSFLYPSCLDAVIDFVEITGIWIYSFKTYLEDMIVLEKIAIIQEPPVGEDALHDSINLDITFVLLSKLWQFQNCPTASPFNPYLLS